MADKPICSIQDCGKPAKLRGQCEPHYRKALSYGDRSRGRRGGIAVCTVEGCDRSHRCRGFCAIHYDHWKRRNDVRKRASPGVLQNFIDAAVSSNTDECIVWPLRTEDWYLLIYRDGRHTSASNWVCRQAHGEPPTPLHEACHSCNHPPCINPNHLRWGTGKENQADRVAHGTDCRGEKNPRAKLTTDQVLFIKANPDATAKELAELLSVKIATVYKVRQRKNWAHV